MIARLAIIATLMLAGCVRGDKAGPYPYGFQLFGHQHYLDRRFFGANEPIRDPISGAYVVTDGDGNFYVSPALANRLNPKH